MTHRRNFSVENAHSAISSNGSGGLTLPSAKLSGGPLTPLSAFSDEDDQALISIPTPNVVRAVLSRVLDTLLNQASRRYVGLLAKIPRQHTATPQADCLLRYV